VKEQDQYFLGRDIYSIVRKGRLYGSKGDRVTVQWRSGHVCCVVSENGYRFPVVQEDLVLKVEIQPPKEEPPSILPKVPLKKIRKTNAHRPLDDSLSLF